MPIYKINREYYANLCPHQREEMLEQFDVDKDGNIVGEPIMGSKNLEDWKATVEKQLEEIKAGK